MKRRELLTQGSLFTLGVAGTQLANTLGGQEFGLIEPAAAQSLKELNFGIISTESQANQKPLWEPFIAAMSKAIGMPVKPFYSTQYAGVIEAMRFNRVQVAWYGGKAYIEAVRIANAEAFAQTVSLDGSKGYYAYLIMNKANPNLAAAKRQGGEKFVLSNASKLSFAFNDPNSTSGFLVPNYYVFAKNDVDPKKAFKRLVFSGSHEATALAIANNQVDVATNNNESIERLKKTNPSAHQKIEIIWTSPVIPSDPIAYRKDLPANIKQKIQNFMYNYKDKKVLDALQWRGLVRASDATWNPIRELDLAKKILDIKNKDQQSAEDKRQLAALEQQLRAIQKR